jgi:ligand-binding sensor domain-containing protein
MPSSRFPGARVRRVAFLAFTTTALLASAASAYVGQWHSYTDKSRVSALIAHQGYVFAGTQGGVRRIDPETLAFKDYGNLEGLADPWIASFAADSSGTLWAASHSGYVYALPPGKYARWTVRSRSYASQSWTMNDRAMLAAGTHLYIGSDKGLGIFDTRNAISQLNINRFGNATDVEVYALLSREDTLYLGTSAGAYKARIYFPDPLSPPSGYANPADYQQWIKIASPPGVYFNHLVFQNGSLAFYSAGTVVYPSRPGEVLIKALWGSPLQIGSQVYQTRKNVTSAINLGGKVFTGGDEGVLVSTNPSEAQMDATPIDSLASFPLNGGTQPFPRDTIANITASNGHVWGHSPEGLWRLDTTSGRFVFTPALMELEPELYTRSLRNAKIAPDGSLYIGTWGHGVVRGRDTLIRAGETLIRPVDTLLLSRYTYPLPVPLRLPTNNDGAKAKDTLTPARDTIIRLYDAWTKSTEGGGCLQEILPNFLVVHAIGTPKGSDLFFSIYTSFSSGTYQLAHVNTATGRITCLDSTLTGTYPHGLEILAKTPDSTLVGIASDRGVTFVILDEGPDGPVVRSAALWTVSASSNEAWDLAADQWGRPWALINDQLAYLDSLDLSQSRRLKAIDNFAGTSCKSLEADPAGLLWVGCDNGLFQVRTGPSGEIVSVRRHNVDDGLPSLYIYDVSIDQTSGQVWVTTDRGIAMYESASQPKVARGDIPKVIPYPNPFRPEHSFVVFRGLPSNSTLRIHEPSGRVIRIFKPRDLLGTEIHWDGKNGDGKAVPPGVYVFSVTSGSSVERGKVIVAR